MKIFEKLVKIQNELKAPKNQYNKFGNYSYRNCEDILESLKPLLEREKLTLLLGDELVMIGERYYVRSTATLTDGEEEIKNSAFAREEETKKGMDGSQITGASSSYARKYALNGLFLIDDMKDSDATNTGQKQETKKQTTEKEETTGSSRIVLINRINELELELNVPHEKTLEIYKVSSNSQMTESQLQDCINKLEDAKKKRGK